MIAHQDNSQENSVSDSPNQISEEFLAPACCHYWIIETANGPISRGQCQYCFEIKDFKNSVFDMDREEKETEKTQTPDSEPAAESKDDSRIPEAVDESVLPETVAV